MINIRRTVWSCLTFIIALSLMIGCSGSRLSREGLFKTRTSSQKSKKALYHDFGDVLIPHELKKDKRSSFVYHTPGFSGGVIALKGRVDMNSLISFFSTNMARDNWRLISSFKSPRSIMLFHKESKWCVISISDREFSTYVEVWVAPTIAESPRETQDERTFRDGDYH